MKILFLHGWHTVPGGVKPTNLKDHSHTVINPAIDDDDFTEALKTAQAKFDQHQPLIQIRFPQETMRPSQKFLRQLKMVSKMLTHTDSMAMRTGIFWVNLSS